MKTFAPNYYNSFKCIADRCLHSCCKGWEICIDGDTLGRYENTDGDLGRRLKENIIDGAFVLREDESCPFLNNGLCDIITQKGEGYLCEICREHPRFYNFFSHRTEVGLGMSCEEAARIILSQTEKTELVLFENGEHIPPFADEAELLGARDGILDLLQNRSKSVASRAEEMLDAVGISFPEKTAGEWREIFLGLEILDGQWKSKLSSLTDTEKEISAELEIPLEKLLIYLIYRHIPGAVDGDDFRARVAFAYLGYKIVRRISANREEGFEEFCDTARQYSAEIEYSEENTETLIDIFR